MRSEVLAVVAFALISCAPEATVARPHTANELRDGARSSCVGVSDADREAEPFAKRDRIEAVAEIVETDPHPKLGSRQVRGVEIVLRAQPGLTRAWLARVLRSHQAFHAIRPEALSVRSDDETQARETVRRAHMLISRALTLP